MKQLICIITIVTGLLSFRAGAQEQIHLFPDRTFCVSGDTVWFSAVISGNGTDNTNNIIHIQLDDLRSNHITKVSVASDKNSGSGYLLVPDSLSTGIYALKAFSNVQKKNPSAVFFTRLLVVYNRFDENISEFNIPDIDLPEKNSDEGISIAATPHSGKSKTVEVDVNLEKSLRSEALEMIVTARLFDPFADQFTKAIESRPDPSMQNAYMPVRENNGILISGRIVQNQTETPVKNTPVFLSIADTLPYFDYCVSDEQGRFYFYVRNAVGKGDIVIQEVSKQARENRIELLGNYIETEGISTTRQILTLAQNTFASDLVKAAYFSRIYKGYRSLPADSFSISKDFQYPFYGPPTFTFYPELFIDLPNFQEISREILNGVQYREKKDEVSIRLLNRGNRSIFNNEPLKLLDGIPIFDSKLLSKLNTQTIEKVDAVYFKRFFGDISFDGVLAVYSKNPTLGWVESVPELNIFKYTFIQPALTPTLHNQPPENKNIPDFRTVFYRERRTDLTDPINFRFERSDIKGDVLIEVIAVCKDKRIVKTRKVIHLD